MIPLLFYDNFWPDPNLFAGSRRFDRIRIRIRQKGLDPTGIRCGKYHVNIFGKYLNEKLPPNTVGYR